jgi:methylglutaconyl-CoA hydratase
VVYAVPSWNNNHYAYLTSANAVELEVTPEDNFLPTADVITPHLEGAAFGGALGLIAACDEVIAEEGTQFCFSEVKLGIAPAVISSFVQRKTVPGKVRPLMLSAVVFNAHTAQQAGLVTDVVAAGEGHNAIQKVIQTYMQCGPEAVRETKKLLNDIGNMTWEQQRDRTTNLIAERRASDEGQEGLKSFLEKREPSWRT